MMIVKDNDSNAIETEIHSFSNWTEKARGGMPRIRSNETLNHGSKNSRTGKSAMSGQSRHNNGEKSNAAYKETMIPLL